ncbi:dynein axonemal heavy chain 10 isoform X2 [Episyrphus balteatus]|uniref:dynein axonemal heavy chain 10 isoform X2 n=1 Tax=Episyrphus balteatus TaxID=286459 RepID=UPI0024854A73|nr:dynein axonemal heavy chain 10 isoform X2 [Episyrphus balteatus]
MEEDNRIDWIKYAISNALGVFDAKFVNPLIEENYQKFYSFVDSKNLKTDNNFENILVFVWRTFYDKLVEEEITILEEVLPPPVVEVDKKDRKAKKKDQKGKSKPPTKTSSNIEMAQNVVQFDGIETKTDPESAKSSIPSAKKSTKGKKKSKKSKVRDAPAEPIYVEVKKIIQSFVKTPILHCHFGTINQLHLDPNMKYIYLVRNSSDPIIKYADRDECFVNMPKCFYFGSIKGSFIENFKMILEKVYTNVVEYHFQEPETVTPSSQLTISEEDASITRENNSGLLDLAKPSELRALAVMKQQKKLERLAKNQDLQIENIEQDDKKSIEDDKKGVITSSLDIIEPPAEKLAISERWEILLATTHKKALEYRKQKNSAFKRKSLYNKNLLKWVNDLSSEVNWTTDHIVWDFNLPTAYNAPGQEDIEFEESKKKIPIDIKSTILSSFTQSQLEDVAFGWMFHVKKRLKELKEKQLEEFTPMAEYKLWNQREMETYSIIEELKTDFVLSVLDALEASGSGIIENWKTFFENIETYYKLAKENSNYLSTIKDYLEKIRSYNNFKFMTLLLSDLMVGLNHIWTMSSYYCRDENMQILLNQISYVFTEKIKNIVALDDIFKHPANIIYETAKNCASFLFFWKSSYMATRAKIENSGVGSRWEFDRKTLFNEVDHICRISQDIAYIAKVFVQFENLFGYRLKSILIDPSIVDVMMEKVYCLLGDIMRVDYDIFRPANWENWEDTLDGFNRKLNNVETEAMVVIDQCVTSLRSSYLGLALITDIYDIDTREKLVEYISEKHENILRFFVTEINTIEYEFTNNKKKPPLGKHQPASIATIRWIRLLSNKLKKSVIAFKELENSPHLKNSYLKRSTFKQYYELVNQMFLYEQDIFDKFTKQSTYNVNAVMRNNILSIEICNIDSLKSIARATEEASTRKFDANKDERDGVSPRGGFVRKITKFTVIATLVQWLVSRPPQMDDLLKKAKEYFKIMQTKKLSHPQEKFRMKQCELIIQANNQEYISTWRELVGDQVLIELEMQFQVNINKDIFNVLHEGQEFEHLGFKLPDAIRTTIMRKNLLFTDYEAIQGVISEYNSIISILSLSEVDFLRDHLYEIEVVIQAGVGRYTWQSFNIQKFASNIKTLLRKLVSTVSQINNIRVEIKSRINKMENFNLFKLIESDEINAQGIFLYEFAHTYQKTNNEKSIEINNDTIYSCDEYLRKLRESRDEKNSYMKKIVDSLGPVLVKLESLVLGTFTGRSEKMKEYYGYWETEIFDCILRYTHRNFKEFLNSLMGNVPTFEIKGLLLMPEIVLHPNASELQNIFVQSAKDFLERIRVFKRWMSGTCLLCPPVENKGNKYAFTFYEDVLKKEEVVALLKNIQYLANRVVDEAQSYVRRFKKFYGLWSYDKVAICEKFVNSGAPLVQFDEKFTFFAKVIHELRQSPTYCDVRCIRIDVKPIIECLCEHALEWKNTLGEILANKTRRKMTILKDEIKHFQINLDKSPKNLDDFKIVMAAIVEIQSKTISYQLEITEMQQIYMIFSEHSIKFDYNDMLMAHHLEKRWKRIYRSSLYRSFKLGAIKQKFAEIVTTDINKFLEELQDFIEDFEQNGPGSVGSDLDRGTRLIDTYGTKFKNLEERRTELSSAEKLFDIPVVDYNSFTKVRTDFDGMQLIYRLYKQQKIARENWSKTLWVDLDPQILNDGIESYIKEFRKLPKKVRDLITGQMLELQMKQFRNSIPLMVSLKNEALRERHWRLLMQKTGKVFDMAPDVFTLENMFNMQLHQYQEIAETILNNALKELSIEKGIREVEETWAAMAFKVHTHLKGKEDRGYILGSVEEIMQVLDDNSTNLQSMGASQFIGPFLQNVNKWERTLALVYEIVDEWISVQRKWLYLEGIFVGGDIRSQLPEEARKFDDIDKVYRRIMVECAKNPIVIQICTIAGRLSELQSLNSGLEDCQKSLNEYLESKRRIFPRFYFISTDELLSILGSSEPTIVQDHIIKMYDNIKSLSFSKNSMGLNIVLGMVSSEGETMEFRNIVIAQGRVEIWMNDVLKEMRHTNWYITKKAINDYGRKAELTRIDWIMMYQGMVTLAGSQLWWTTEVEQTFASLQKGNNRAMKDFLRAQNEQIKQLVIKVRSELSRNDRLKFKTITTIDVHAKDIIETFVRDNILDAQEFGWESQLRFYWIKQIDDLCVVQCTGRFNYGYEYMGLNGRLVITPLTDRIYLTITQALVMNIGAAPAGPAGTGKTETCKDLAKAMALLCIVTNCGEGMDFRAVGSILAGLCQSGAWGCFDEFNRIEISVLSVISTQIQTIRSGLQKKLKLFMFEGVEISLDPKVGVFVTMNPGYAGRTELPESVKALFRPVTCIKPDLELICLISLFSDGFLTSKVLAKKMTVLYKLAQEQLSKQCHYDWGLRSLNSVLRMAGVMQRQSNELPESVVLMRVLRDMNFPKFVFDDVSLFLGLIKDLFPGIDCPRVGYPEFNAAIRHVLTTDGYIILPDQEDKVVQMYETMMTRHSTMIVGPTSGGKTVVINTLIKAQCHLGLPTKCITLNPKAFSVIQLYGYLDMNTRDWIDGLFSNIFRDMNKPTTKEERRYVCFDGDVDALWIENMNSVMDDNKLLTLANGERIRLENHCGLLFEVGNLSYASPATVSRAGMVYVDPKNLRYTPYWQRWVLSRPELEQSFLHDKFDQIIVPAISFIFEGLDGTQQGKPLKTVIPQTDLNMIVQFCNLYDAIFAPPPINPDADEPFVNYNPGTLECGFIECIYGSLGACLAEFDRERFDEFIKRSSGLILIEDSQTKPASEGQLPITKPTLYDYYFDCKLNVWTAWEWVVPLYEHNPNIKFSEILVPTIDTLRTNNILNLMSTKKRPVLLIGDAGSSKTAIIIKYLRELDTSSYIILNANFSSRTTSLDVQRTIEAAVEKRTKDTFGPPIGKQVSCFIDDMNMPQVDEYGTQQPIALLKLLFEFGGMFDRGKDLNWKKFKDLTFYAAMGYPGGGRNDVDPRFISMFSVYNLVFPNEESLRLIYSSIFKGHIVHSKFPENLHKLADTIVNITLNLFKITIAELPPTPSKFHYVFNLRDLSRIFGGLLQIRPNFFNQAREIVRVWRNEFSRSICDRLISENDINLMKKHIETEIIQTFTPTFELDEGYTIAKSSSSINGEKVEKNQFSVGADSEESILLEADKIIPIADYVLRNPLLFGDYRNSLNESEPRYYEDLLDFKAIFFLFQEIVEEYGERKGKLSLVLFEDCLEHLTRVHRTLRLYRGHVLLVGVGGSGKKSITKLASFAADCEVFEITIARGYNEISFREDLKKLYYLTGLDRKKVVFILSGGQIVEEGFLELINNILTTGVVSALFTDDEKDAIIAYCHPHAIDAGYSSARVAVWAYFINKCNENLHVVLCMSPTGESLRNRCRNFPGLIGSTSIDWIFPWPKQALFAVAELFLTEHPMIPEAHRDKIVNHVVHVHGSMDFYSSEYKEKLRRNNYVTPKHYLDFITTYLKLLENENNFIKIQSNRLREGIIKIDDAAEQIDQLRIIVTEQKQNVEVASTDCETMMVDIESSTQKANVKKAEASEKSMEVEIKGKQIAIEKADAEVALSEAMPALEEARRALANLDKSQITEIRSFATPPPQVQVVCECVAILKGLKEINWKSAKGMMSDVNFLRSLMEMDCEALTARQINACRAHMKSAPGLDDMDKISQAGAGLLGFVRAVISFFEVFREVKPKKERVDFLEQEQNLQIKILYKLNNEITQLEETLDVLNSKYAESIRQMKMLTEMMNQAERRLVASDRLISGLTSERSRWSEVLIVHGEQKSKLVGQCLVCASFLAYAGAFSWEFRKTMLYNDWLNDLRSHEIPIADDFDLARCLSTEVQVCDWISKGLPPDEFSVQNGILTVRASRFPLCIDPQEQALRWIKKSEAQNNLKILSFNDPDFLKQIESSIMYGIPVLFQDVDDYIDPVIDPILEKNIRVAAGRKFIILGDREVDYDENFRIYLTTKFANPVFDPAVYAKAMVVNYSVTNSGLEDQLLSVVVQCERPDLEEQREKLILQTSENKKLLKQLEDSLLRELATSTGNMLDNIELVETLENAKTKASAITKQLKLSSETVLDIEKLRDGYRPVAKRGAVLFFALSDMAAVSSMYQYALNSFLDVFAYSLKKSVPDSLVSKRISNIITTLTENVYSFGCMGIFGKHKLLFSFQLATKLEQSDGRLSQAEINFFIRGSVSLKKSEKHCPASWITEQNWKNIETLSNEFPFHFENLAEHIEHHLNEWKEWFELEVPEQTTCPGEFNSVCSSFQKLMLLRCFREDRVYLAINNYIMDTMDEFFITPPVISLPLIYEQSTNMVPVCFILSAGTDPTNDLLNFAGRSNQKISHISLGQGQEKAALSLLDASIRQGQWLLLQNGHLLINFIRQVEKYLEKIENPHPDFRLWITTDPTPTFPIGILQRSLKVVTEAPNGLKLNLNSTFYKLEDDSFNSCAHVAFKPLVYVLAFFHAVLQERRRYDKLGWNINYDFNECDFDVCLNIIKTYLNKALDAKDSRIPWESLKYLIGEVMYGGRVIDDYDRRIVQTYLNEYMGDFIFDSFQPFFFYKDNEFEYGMPIDMDHVDDIAAYVDQLPLVNTPEVFGLHANADIGNYTQATKAIWSHLIDLQPQTGDVLGGTSRDEFIDSIAADILNKLPQYFEVWRIKKMFQMNITPTGVVLLQELERFNLLTARMRKTLELLRKALAGETGMDNMLDNIANSLLNGKLPSYWASLTPATCKQLGSWIEQLLNRATQYHYWSLSGEPMVIWLAGLHIPESYLTAVVQIACRKNGWPLDKSTLYTNVTHYVDPDDVEERPTTGCYVHGLFIEGARWDSKRRELARSQPKVLVEDLPLLAVIPIEVHRLKLQNTFRAPVYTTSLRRNAMGIGLVFEANLETHEDLSHWVLQGCCLTLNRD